MAGYVVDIEKEAETNENFRRVLFTAEHSQLVVMSLAPNEDIGEEVHENDQFIRIESGKGKAVLNGQEHEVKDGWAVVIPAGVRHNIINTSSTGKMKLYTIYSPAEHKDGTIHPTRQEALKEEHHH